MLPTTIKIVRSGLESDPTLTPADRNRLMAGLRHDAKPRTRLEVVAKRLSCSLRTVDKLPLTKIKLPGRQRAAGFLESDINALLQ